jgi:indolepyruvate decarboxylase
VDAALAKIQAAKTGCILPAFTVSRFGLQAEVTALIEASGLPFATTAMDKAALSEWSFYTVISGIILDFRI